MTFLELQNATLTDRFSESKRADSKTWINYRYGRLWAQEPWAFKTQSTPLAVTSGALSVAKGAVGDILSIQDATDTTTFRPLVATRPEDFYSYARTTGSGFPYTFSIIGNTLYFDRPMDMNRTLTVLSELPFTPLAADGDVPLIPSEFHYALAAAARSEGLRAEQDPSWQAEEDAFKAAVEDMRREYLTSDLTYQDFYPSWP
jgi:hypothetical protein